MISSLPKKALKCSSCVHFKARIGKKPTCTLFRFKGPTSVYFADTQYCRDLEMLCGPNAKYFEAEKEQSEIILFDL